MLSEIDVHRLQVKQPVIVVHARDPLRIVDRFLKRMENLVDVYTVGSDKSPEDELIAVIQAQHKQKVKGTVALVFGPDASFSTDYEASLTFRCHTRMAAQYGITIFFCDTDAKRLAGQTYLCTYATHVIVEPSLYSEYILKFFPFVHNEDVKHFETILHSLGSDEYLVGCTWPSRLYST